MSLDRVKGLLIQELFITIRSFEVIMDVVVFPAMSVILFGYLAAYLSGNSNLIVAKSLLIGMLLWQIVFIVQYSVSVGSLWNIWSKNLSNMFITPLTIFEYLLAQSLSGVIKSFFIFIPSSIFSILIFHVNIFDIGIVNLVIYLFNLIFFALSFGIVILGLIFRFGTRIQAFAWGLLPIIQPLTGTLYPVTVLPAPMQFISNFLPPKYIFEAIRENLNNPSVFQWQSIESALFINVIYFVVAVLFFNFMFNESKKSGQFARLEG